MHDNTIDLTMHLYEWREDTSQRGQKLMHVVLCWSAGCRILGFCLLSPFDLS